MLTIFFVSASAEVFGGMHSGKWISGTYILMGSPQGEKQPIQNHSHNPIFDSHNRASWVCCWLKCKISYFYPALIIANTIQQKVVSTLGSSTRTCSSIFLYPIICCRVKSEEILRWLFALEINHKNIVRSCRVSVYINRFLLFLATQSLQFYFEHLWCVCMA